MTELGGGAQDLVIGDPRPADLYDARLYARGALTLHALRLVLRDSRFFALLTDWHERHRGGAAETGEFIALAGQAGGGAELTELLSDWLFRAPLPRLPTR